MQDITYRVNGELNFNTLRDYGFWKTEPKDTNPWYQYSLKTDWSSGIGIWNEGVNINLKTYEAKIRCDHDKWTDELKSKVQYFIDEGILLENQT